MKKIALLSIVGVLLCQIIFGQNFNPRQSYYRDFKFTVNEYQDDDVILKFLRCGTDITIADGKMTIKISKINDPALYAIYGLRMFRVSIRNKPCLKTPLSDADLIITQAVNGRPPIVITGEIYLDAEMVAWGNNNYFKKIPGKITKVGRYKTFSPYTMSPSGFDPDSRILDKYSVSVNSANITDLMNRFKKLL